MKLSFCDTPACWLLALTFSGRSAASVAGHEALGRWRWFKMCRVLGNPPAERQTRPDRSGLPGLYRGTRLGLGSRHFSWCSLLGRPHSLQRKDAACLRKRRSGRFCRIRSRPGNCQVFWFWSSAMSSASSGGERFE